MPRSSSSSIAIALLGTLTAATLAAQQRAPNPILIRASRLLDVRAGSYRAAQGIWIDDGRIRQIGAFEEVRATAPSDISVLDLGGAAVLPGLIDCHAHLLDAMDPGASSVDNLVLTLAKDSATKRALLGAAMAREILDAGFTTVRNVGHSGIDGDVSLRDAIRSGWLPGPRIAAAARKIVPHGGQSLQPVQSSVVQTLIDQEFVTAVTPADGRRAVLENLRVGADLIKVVADDGPCNLILSLPPSSCRQRFQNAVLIESLTEQVSVEALGLALGHAVAATQTPVQQRLDLCILVDRLECVVGRPPGDRRGDAGLLDSRADAQFAALPH